MCFEGVVSKCGSLILVIDFDIAVHSDNSFSINYVAPIT